MKDVDQAVLFLYLLQVGDPRHFSEKWAGKTDAYLMAKLSGMSEERAHRALERAVELGYVDKVA